MPQFEPFGVSAQAERTQPSKIRGLMDLALTRPGTIRLELGEPDFATPSNIVEAAVKALHDGHTKYTPNAGIVPLREAIVDKIERVNGYRPDLSEVVVVNGATQGLHAIFDLLLEPGDEVLLPSPAWPNFTMIAQLLGAKPVPYRLGPDTDYQPSSEMLEDLVTEKTRVLLLNSPSNPLGTMLSRETLADVLQWAERKGIWVISDECYDELTYESKTVSAAAVGDRSKIISIYSFSKTFAMTGWRVGYVVVPEHVVAQLLKIQEPLVSCVNTPAQYGAIEALTGPQDAVDAMREAYRRRRDAAVARLDEAGIEHVMPQGAFYLWLEDSFGASGNLEFFESLVVSHGVSIAPGAAFGSSIATGCRISLAAADSDILQGIERLVAAVDGR